MRDEFLKGLLLLLAVELNHANPIDLTLFFPYDSIGEGQLAMVGLAEHQMGHNPRHDH
jgi:hypothetical protein